MTMYLFILSIGPRARLITIWLDGCTYLGAQPATRLEKSLDHSGVLDPPESHAKRKESSDFRLNSTVFSNVCLKFCTITVGIVMKNIR